MHQYQSAIFLVAERGGYKRLQASPSDFWMSPRMDIAHHMKNSIGSDRDYGPMMCEYAWCPSWEFIEHLQKSSNQSQFYVVQGENLQEDFCRADWRRTHATYINLLVRMFWQFLSHIKGKHVMVGARSPAKKACMCTSKKASWTKVGF